MNPERRLVLYTPHAKQIGFHTSRARFKVLAFGRQAGKTTASMNEVVRHAWEKPGTTYWFVEPIFSQAKDVYRKMRKFLPADIVTNKSDTELRIELINGSVIEFKSGETMDNLRGPALHGCIIDEVREQNPDLWPMVIRPMLTTTQGWCAFVSTPNGYDSFYDIAENARRDNTGDWFFDSAESTANPLFTQEEYERCKREMSEAQFAQEIKAEFRDIHVGKAYVNFSDANLKAFNPLIPNNESEIIAKFLPIVVAMDFNINPMAWTLGQHSARRFYWFDEVWIENSHTQEAAKELVNRVRGHAPGVIIVGDATAKASQRAAAGKSDYDILLATLREAGIPFVNQTPDSNPLVKDRVNTVNSLLKGADGTVSQWFHPRFCPHAVRDMQRVSWKKGAQGILDQSTNPMLTHASDGIGYANCVLAPIEGVNQVGSIRFVRRI